MSSSRYNRQSLSTAENQQTALRHNKSEDTVVSGAMAQLLMRKGFGVRPKCTETIIEFSFKTDL